MKYLILILSLLLFGKAFAREPSEIGMCTPEYQSKVYIQNDFEERYPKEVIFKCNYYCRSNKGVEKISGKSTVTVRTTSDDARRVVCNGVKVKKVSWGWDFDGIESFYAYDTNIVEIKKWAFSNIDKNNSRELELLKKLKVNLSSVARSYLVVSAKGFEYYPEAGAILLDIASELPGKTDKLDFYIDKVKGKTDMQSRDGLISAILLSNARFRVN